VKSFTPKMKKFTIELKNNLRLKNSFVKHKM